MIRVGYCEKQVIYWYKARSGLQERASGRRTYKRATMQTSSKRRLAQIHVLCVRKGTE